MLLHPDEKDLLGSESDESGSGSESDEERDRDRERGVDADKKAVEKEKRRHAKELASSGSGRTIQLRPKHFIGPSSFTLQMYNVRPLNPDSKVPNIRTNYSVCKIQFGMLTLEIFGLI
jgi:hypothetical protein